MNDLLKKIKELQEQIKSKTFKENCMEDELCIRQLKYELKVTRLKYRKSKMK